MVGEVAFINRIHLPGLNAKAILAGGLTKITNAAAQLYHQAVNALAVTKITYFLTVTLPGMDATTVGTPNIYRG